MSVINDYFVKRSTVQGRGLACCVRIELQREKRNGKTCKKAAVVYFKDGSPSFAVGTDDESSKELCEVGRLRSNPKSSPPRGTVTTRLDFRVPLF